MSKYGTKFKTINTQIATPLEEIISELRQTEQSEVEQLEQLEQLEQVEQLGHNRNSIFFKLNHDNKLDCAVLIAMLSGMLIFTVSLCSQDNNRAIIGVTIALAAFFLRVAVDLMEEGIENNSSTLYQSHYRN